MYQKLSITLLCVLFPFFTFSQVKKTYQSKDHQQTTVVVKEKQASDLDVLNTHFDTDDYGMDQVIRITTEGDVVPVNTQTQLAQTEQPDFKTPIVLESKEEILIEEEPLVTVSNEEEEEANITDIVNQDNQPTINQKPSTKASKKTTLTSTKSRSTYTQRKRKKGERIRLKKRKRSRKNYKKHCYKF